MRKYKLLPLFSLPFFLIFSTGCMHSPSALERKDRATYAAIQRSTEKAKSNAGASVVFFEVENTTNDGRGQKTRKVNFAGIVLTPEGHLLAPFAIPPGSDTRVETWVGERRYLARALKVDESLGMTIMKIEPFEALVPLPLDAHYEILPGEMVYTVIPTDDDREFEKFVFQAFCQGIVQGRYRQYSLSSIPDIARGAPLFDSYGNLTGLVAQTNAWIYTDIALDIEEMLARTLNGKGGNHDDDSSEGWFGAILAPINPDYARYADLPPSGLWLNHVFKDSAAWEAGFRSGDLLVELNGEPMRLTGSRAYRFFLQSLRPLKDEPFSAVVIRDGKRIKGKGILLKRPEPDTLRADDLGFTVTEIHETMEIRFNLYTTQGVMVSDIKSGSPAATGRSFGEPLIRNGDVIVSIGGHATPTLQAFGEALEKIRKEKPSALLVKFQRGSTTGIEALNLRIGAEKGDK
jgi:serine protease Do